MNCHKARNLQRRCAREQDSYPLQYFPTTEDSSAEQTLGQSHAGSSTCTWKAIENPATYCTCFRDQHSYLLSHLHRGIPWDHRSGRAFSRAIHWDPRPSPLICHDIRIDHGSRYVFYGIQQDLRSCVKSAVGPIRITLPFLASTSMSDCATIDVLSIVA